MFGQLRGLKKTGFQGLMLYTRTKLGKPKKINVPGIETPVHFRKGSSDIPTFHQIFCFDEYGFEFKSEPKTIIDAGANVGFAALYFARRFPDAMIYSIEPEKSNFDALEKNTNQLPNVKAYKNALSNVSGQQIEIVDSGRGEWGFMTKKSEANEVVKEKVATISISEIMSANNLDSVDIVKIDIEGAEQELFENNFDWLANTRCLIIELHDRMRDKSSQNFFKAITQYDFSFANLGENLIFTNNAL